MRLSSEPGGHLNESVYVQMRSRSRLGRPGKTISIGVSYPTGGTVGWREYYSS